MIWEEINKKDLLYLNSDLLSLLFEFKIVNSNEMDDYKVFYTLEEFKYSVVNPIRDNVITLDIYTTTEDPRVLDRRLNLRIPNSQGLQINKTLCKSVNLINQELGSLNRIHDTSKYIINDSRVYPDGKPEPTTTTTTGPGPTTSTTSTTLRPTTTTTLKPEYVEDLESNFNYAEYFKLKINETDEL